MSLLRPSEFDLVEAPARPETFYQKHLKRGFDFAAALGLILAVSPILIVAAVLVMLDGHSPVFVQERIGRNGRLFRMLKLRSMVPDAAGALQRHLAGNTEARLEWDETQKLRKDPRITWIGRFLRKTSIDELPQLFNVLTGDLSLVGPRPLLPSQLVMYPGRAYFGMVPGLTGLWQVEGRSETAIPDRARYDRRYADRVSFWRDLSILLRTFGAVARATGV